MTMNDTNPMIQQPVHQPAHGPAPDRPTWSKGKTIGAVVVAVAVAVTAGITVEVVDKSSGTGNSAGGASPARCTGRSWSPLSFSLIKEK
jgi:hypothetical protein